MATDPAKLIVITGVTRGLGRALAEGFAALGHRVIGCGRSSDLIGRLGHALGEPHDFAPVDVTDEAQVRAWAEFLLVRHGTPDLLLNNAAQINRNAPLWKVPAEEFDRIVDVNIKGTANVLRHLVPAMIERGRGVIVNFSSYWGWSVSPEVAPYCATKFAIEGLTRALAQELPPGLAAVPFNPGIINTDMLRSCYGDKAKAYLSPQEWCRAAIPFLLQLGPKDNGKSVTAPGQ